MPNPSWKTIPDTRENRLQYTELRADRVAESLSSKLSSASSLFIKTQVAYSIPAVFIYTIGLPDGFPAPPFSKQLQRQIGWERVPSIELIRIALKLLELTEPTLSETERFLRLAPSFSLGSFSATLSENWTTQTSTPYLSTSIDDWPHAWNPSQNTPNWTPISGVSVTYTVHFSDALVRKFQPLPPRSPRKWGRAWTPRWELEHAALVRQRKFARNQKRIEKDNMALKKRRTALSRKRRAAKRRRDRAKNLATPKVCRVILKYKKRKASKRKK